jgi:hypothetical protein
MISTLHNLSDEADVQCVMFLATEFGLIRPAPFYFSRSGAPGVPAPESLVLRHTLQELLDTSCVTWENGCLRCVENLAGMPAMLDVQGGIAWLGTLSARERKVLARATLDLHRAGVDVVSPMADTPFRASITRALGDLEGFELLEHRLMMARYQLRSA